MHATSTVHAPSEDSATASDTVPPRSDSKTFARAVADLKDGFNRRELWLHLGWQDIKQRYRRSVIGPFWITISQGITALGLGLLYSQLLDTSISTFLPYITTGFIVWNFILGCVTEGTETFIANEGLIKHLPAPITIYVFRTVWRQTLMLAHNFLIYLIVVVVFWGAITKHGYTISAGGTPQPGLSWTALLAIPGFFLLALNAAWLTVVFGIISTRFRDLPQVVSSLINLAFFATPIVWSTDILEKKFANAASWRGYVAELNPLYHYVQVVRAPLIGAEINWHSWVVVGGLTVLGWSLAMVVLRNYRSRVSYWV
ncbi:ABC transporter permease [Amycolatopsis sp.]|uniref:galactan export ABC transporter permease subunit Wzm/RfbD n=1 Tax=Amycolatopsis sp. TaxID=37632 RepID=UPI00262D0053|nr:ABC transporter permease [Amycolatopsis sp.]